MKGKGAAGFVLLGWLACGIAEAGPLPAGDRQPAQSIIEELKLVPRPGKFGFVEAPFPYFAARRWKPTGKIMLP